MSRSNLYQILWALSLLFWASPGLPSSDRHVLVEYQIKGISIALQLFELDHCRLPSESEGLEVLVHPDRLEAPPTLPCKSTANTYLKKVPIDPWDNPIHYRFPGIHNPKGFDLWSLGADGVVGGLDHNRDRGNWEQDDGFAPNFSFGLVEWLIVLVSGFLIGFPYYVFHSIKHYRVNRTLRNSFVGDHLGVFAYIYCWTTFLLFVINASFS